jgi:hypothetical protein
MRIHGKLGNQQEEDSSVEGPLPLNKAEERGIIKKFNYKKASKKRLLFEQHRIQQEGRTAFCADISTENRAADE